MIVEATTEKIEVSPEIQKIQTSAFTLKATKEAFEILSSGLYSDKIRAAQRELGTNASDAHNDNNIPDKPFDVHLPNQLEPFFYVRDYGKGMSNKTVKGTKTNKVGIYNTYFASTKTDSNDVEGQLGLGSKSPSCVSDSYTVTIWRNGRKRIYNCYKDEDGLPQISLIAVQASKEPTGVQVSFPVKSHEFNEFRNKAQRVYSYFRVKPNFLGNSIVVESPKYSITHKDWAVREYNNYSGANIVMGNIPYPISDYSAENLEPKEQALLKMPFDIKVPIGAINVAASREKPSYTAKTKATVKMVLSNIVSDFQKVIEEKIQNATSLYEARCMLWDLKNGSWSELFFLVDNASLAWKNEKLNFEIVTFSNQDVEISRLMRKEKRRRRGYSYSGGKPRYEISIFSSGFWATFKNKFYVNDLWNSEFKYKKTVLPRLISIKENNEKDDIIIIKEKIVGGLRNFKYSIGLPDDFVFNKVSDIPYTAPEKIKAERNYTYNPKNNLAVFTYNGKDYSPESSWDSTNIDLEGGGVYVTIERYKINGNYPHSYIENIRGSLESVESSLPIVYGIKSRMMDKIKGKKNWVELSDYKNNLVKDYFENGKGKDFIDGYLFDSSLSIFLNTTGYNSFEKKAINYLKYLENDDICKDFIALHERADKENNKRGLYHSYLNIEGKIAPNERYDKMIKDFFEHIATKYPILKIVKDTLWEEDEEILKKYLTV